MGDNRQGGVDPVKEPYEFYLKTVPADRTTPFDTDKSFLMARSADGQEFLLAEFSPLNDPRMDTRIVRALNRGFK